MNKLVFRVNLIWLGLFWVALMSAAFYLTLGRIAKISITRYLLRQEQTLARAEASNLTAFFQDFGSSVSLLAQLNSMDRRDAVTVRDMDAFVGQWTESGLVGGVVLTDRFGQVQFNSNIAGTRDVGESLADRDYFIWAKSQPKEGEYTVGHHVISRLGATKGEVIVVVASPVYQNGDFKGVVAASVKLEPLTERYLELLKLSDSTEVYLVNPSDSLLYSNSSPDQVGLNIIDVFPELENKLVESKEGTLETKEHLIAYSPVFLGNRTWSLVAASSIESVSNLTTPIYIRLTIVPLLVFLTILLFWIVTTREAQKRLLK